jgi:hypothetical protein
MNRRDALKLGLAAGLPVALMPFPAWAFPDRPIKLMVPFSAGGVNDVVGRQWADRMKDLLGTVYVENQGGATARSPPPRSHERRPTAIRSFWAAPARWCSIP